MPALVNYTGDDEFHSGGCLFPTGSYVDVCCPPRKRACITTPFLSRKSKFERGNQPAIDDVLPDECLFEIFRRLPGGKERSAAACVSKKWLILLSSLRKADICKRKRNGSTNLERGTVASVSDDEMTTSDEDGVGYLTRCLDGKKATDTRLAAIAVGTSGIGGLGKLSIRGSNYIRGVTDFGLSAIAHGCSSLSSLSLWNVPGVGDEGLSKIAKECHLLEKLELSHCPSVSDKSLIAIAQGCPNLTTLSIESCSKIGNEGMQAIGKFCSKLRSISIKDCPLVRDHGIASLFSSASSVLSKVMLQGLNITDVSLAVIGHYGKAVTSLMLTGLRYVSAKGFWVMGNARGLQNLISLTIVSCGGTTDASLEAIGKGCTNLKQMCLRKCCFLSDNGLVAFARSSRSLEILQLEECNRVSASGIVGVLSNCATKLKSLAIVKCMGIKDMALGIPMFAPSSCLRSLSIRNCPGFGDVSLAMVGRLCPQLQHVDLSGLCGITDVGILPLLESCVVGLVKVILVGCLNLTDEAVFALTRLHGETLERLSLDGCRKITDASLRDMADKCMLLSDLDVSKCAISDSGIAALSMAEQLSMRVLSVASCSEVTNRSMPALKKLGKTLMGLNLQHCNSLSSSTVTQLVESLWRCDILS